ncbi:nuclear transport factor 2-like [Lycium barbarum]|uniref:nuclear transport factor 2-like n=1 Tax=Lycium barbarum TaxID=112863 RepID=UPI00293F07C9|nr:nuclear transport factor 2-like [Lycium barbarum]
MTTQANQHSAETIALSFVEQYYRILDMLIDQSHRFYKDNSVLSWPQHDGEIKSVTTSEGIKEFIISSHFKDNKVEVITIDSQVSAAQGVLVVVTACLIGQDNSRKSFSQTFFLAPQEKGYYVLNDIFRFVGVEKSSAMVEEMTDENISVASLEPVSLSKATDNVKVDVKEVSEKSEPVDETISVIENQTPKVSYASMVKQGRSLPPKNAPYEIVRVVADVDLPSASKISQCNAKELISNSSGVSKAAAHLTGAAQENNSDDKSQCKSIYIGGLSTDTTRSDVHTVVRQFGPVHTHDVQLKTYDEDGYCCGFVHFQDAISAQNAVKTRHIIIKGREAYIKFKRINKDRGGRAKSPSGGFSQR